MTALPEDYAAYVEEGALAPSTLIAYLPSFMPKPDLHDVRRRLQTAGKASWIGTVEESDATDATEQGVGALRFAIGDDEAPLQFELELVDAQLDDIQPAPLERETPDTASERQQLEACEWCMYLTTHFTGENVLADFHTQLRMLHLAMPEVLAIYDCASYRTHSGNWLREVATSRVPPPPDTLYSQHVVHDDSDAGAWHHTHGLHRCGCIELEMLDVPAASTESYCHLLNVTAALFIEQGTPKPGEPFAAGRDLSLVWLPWEEGVRQQPDGSLGRREDRDEYHEDPSGILFAAGAGAADPPLPITSLQATLEDEPLLFMTAMETRRMSLLAKERYPRFRAMHRRFGSNKDWLFHVKLGYQIDDCPEFEDDNEHLWFDVQEIQGAELVATLLNQPYNIARMQEGDTGRHAVDQLSDWTIDCPHGLFDATSIGRLEETLEETIDEE